MGHRLNETCDADVFCEVCDRHRGDYAICTACHALWLNPTSKRGAHDELIRHYEHCGGGVIHMSAAHTTRKRA